MKFNYVLVIGGIALAILPYMLHSFGASSFALGTICSASLALLIALLSRHKLRLSFGLLYASMSIVLFNILCTSTYYQQYPSFQQLGSVFLAGVLILFAGLLANSLSSISSIQIKGCINFMVRAIIGLSLAAFALNFKILPFSKSILFFSEPSHLAMALTPFVIYAMLTNSKLSSLFWASSLFVLGLCLENLSLVILAMACTVILFLRFKLGIYIQAIVICSLISCFVLFSMTSQYYSSRILLESNNVSSLVYMRGYEAAVASLVRPPFVGVGLQMMALRAPSSPAQEMLDQLDLGGLNQNDGGFVAAKLVSEFGWPGFAALIYLLVQTFPMLIYTLRLSALGKASKGNNIFSSCMVAVLMQLFVRGSGYLGPFLVLAVLAYYFKPVLHHSAGSA
jgi:hypothetical protein